MDWYESVDLEKLGKLAKSNPEGFEKKVKAIIAKTIVGASVETREIQERINKAENSYSIKFSDDPLDFEIKRRKLIDELLDKLTEIDIVLCSKLQKRIDDGLEKALIDLDKLKKLAESDLGLFDKEKEILMLRFALSQPKEKRLKAEQFQWKIDGVCKRGKNRLDRLIKFQTLFYEGVYGENGFIETIQSLSSVALEFQGALVKVSKEKKVKKRAHLKVVK